MKILKNEETGLLALATDEGKLVTKYVYSVIKPANKYGLHKVMKKDKSGFKYCWRTDELWGYINSKGKRVVPLEWGTEESLSDYDDNGYCERFYMDCSALYGADGSVFKFYDHHPKGIDTFEGIITPMEFGVYVAEHWREDKFGLFASKSGKVVDFIYDDIGTFNEFGVAKTMKLDENDEERYGIINALGTELLPCEYLQIIGLPMGLSEKIEENAIPATLPKTCKGLVLIRNDKYNWCVINLGSELIVCDYKYSHISLDCFDGTYLPVCDSETGNWGVVDTTGALVVPCEYRSDYEALNQIEEQTDYDGETTILTERFNIKKRGTKE